MLPLRWDNGASVKLQINGEVRELDGPLSVSGLVDRLGMKSDRVAIELNRDIVPRERWSETDLQDGDQLEIVHFVGGGASHCRFKIAE